MSKNCKVRDYFRFGNDSIILTGYLQTKGLNGRKIGKSGGRRGRRGGRRGRHGRKTGTSGRQREEWKAEREEWKAEREGWKKEREEWMKERGELQAKIAKLESDLARAETQPLPKVTYAVTTGPEMEACFRNLLLSESTKRALIETVKRVVDTAASCVKVAGPVFLVVVVLGGIVILVCGHQEIPIHSII